MDNSKLKTYAIQARRDCIQAVTDRAAKYGLTAKHIEPITEEGDVALIGGGAFARSIVNKRKALEERVIRQGFEQTMEAMAYTWFNRLVAIRYMELHGYLEHGYRVLSHPEGKSTPEVLEHAERLDLPGLDKTTVIDLKLDGTKEHELYRMLLIAQCNALHRAMPFLFEHIADETELLLPDNLLHSDSLIRKLVNEIPEEDWQEVEIIGWLYQFYISEKKDQVIGKVVKSEDIPAATQLFTPNWIVKYLVQNTLGRQWLATYPQSALRQQMEYYIEPAEQTPDVQEQLKAITLTSLNPEELTLLDPACGSGHILVEAYDLFKAIYQERGYRAKDIPALILQKNLFGLEIDDRAAQLAAFALMMKARADDRRILDSEVKPNILAFEDSQGMNPADITHALNSPINKEDVPSEYLFEEIEEEKAGLFSKKALAEKGHVSQCDIGSLLELFENTKTFGSLIQIPPKLAAKLPEIEKRLNAVLEHGDLTHASAHVIKPLLQQARLLARQYDAVVANPPYMGSGFYCAALKRFVDDSYKAGKADLYAVFALRNIQFATRNGYVGMITIPNWMFLASFADLRLAIFQDAPISSLVHNGRGVWGSDFGSCSFILHRSSPNTLSGRFLRLFEKHVSVANNQELERRFHAKPRFSAANADFKKLPGSPVAYWVSPRFIDMFADFAPLSEHVDTRIGLITGDNESYIRNWSEVDLLSIGLAVGSREDAAKSTRKWFPQSKGGDYRKWYGNNVTVLDWSNDGHELQTRLHSAGARTLAHNFNLDRIFEEAVTWTKISSGSFSPRLQPSGYLFNDASSNAFPISVDIHFCLGLLCAVTTQPVLTALNPTLNYLPGTIGSVPTPTDAALQASVGQVCRAAVQLARRDWDAYERSWDFQSLPILGSSSVPRPTLESSYSAWITQNRETIAEMKRLEEENNRLFIDAYGLVDELTPDVPIEQITLTVNPAYRYGGKLTEKEQWARFREDTMAELVSYAIGCMMGRYSLDKPGLIYAHSGNQGFDPSQYQTFPADEDGIIPITDYPWFEDDAANRLEAFVATAWPKEHLEENLSFIAESLGANRNEQARETIRRYLSGSFFKNHLQTYKKRPIYWLFSSGKQRAFQCLVYLHRYHEGTLSRMRTEYVIPLLGKIAARMDYLASDISKATSTSHLKKLEKEKDLLRKQQTELQAFDEQLRHYADQRISLDLDDGVKVNYGKFGNLLAEVKSVVGSNEE
ncbi:MAG: BREX-1 system adenine-specific DNA-methyltransferase PglX [Nitrospirales bacterium]|nr:BREX-1 system adenine-specific DNA-methyltransferase PglX [Nitrospirales bacterium]